MGCDPPSTPQQKSGVFCQEFSLRSFRFCRSGRRGAVPGHCPGTLGWNADGVEDHPSWIFVGKFWHPKTWRCTSYPYFQNLDLWTKKNIHHCMVPLSFTSSNCLQYFQSPTRPDGKPRNKDHLVWLLQRHTPSQPKIEKDRESAFREVPPALQALGKVWVLVAITV